MSTFMNLITSGYVFCGSAKSIITGIVNAIVENVIPLIGIPIAAVGVFKLVLAYRDNNPEAITAAAKDIAIGGVLIGFSIIWSTVGGLITG